MKITRWMDNKSKQSTVYRFALTLLNGWPMVCPAVCSRIFTSMLKLSVVQHILARRALHHIMNRFDFLFHTWLLWLSSLLLQVDHGSRCHGKVIMLLGDTSTRLFF